MLLAASCFGIANAQLMVDQNGKVGVGIETEDTLKSKFAVNSEGDANSTAYIRSYDEASSGLYIYGKPQRDRNFNGLRVYVNSLLNTRFVYGVYSSITSGGTTLGTVGVYGKSGLSLNNRNYGVAGILNDVATSDNNYYGAAVLGNSTSGLLQLEGRYAGYFNGDTRVTGVLTAGSVVTSSDYRLKENVRSLSSSDGCLSKLMSMNVVEFNNKQREYEVSESDLEEDDAELMEQDTAIAVMGLREESINKARWYEDDSPIIKNRHYGLIAQELQKIYPDLVVESQDGYLAINYLEIIPLLIRSVQELNAKVEQYENGNAPVQKAQSRTTDATGIDAIVTTLYQNTPNPFTESTLIRCDVAEDVVKADLYIYNMNGEQITEYAVTERGETSITIDGGSITRGSVVVKSNGTMSITGGGELLLNDSNNFKVEQGGIYYQLFGKIQIID